MRPFVFERVDNAAAAVRAFGTQRSNTQFLAGGTTLLDLMKLDVMRPETVVDINAIAPGRFGQIEASEAGLRLGALVRMADAAEHRAIRRDYPMIAQSLTFA